ncbi:UbiA family prenyltransferase [Nocardia sp. NPDC051030]|uniref:UbiA family prenyltransferase n=1 Tax=Nocardia sp. NPDC051030 TaxID=3155162 RepID=UPI003432FF85
MQIGTSALNLPGRVALSEVAGYPKYFLQEARISVQIIFLIRLCTAAILSGAAYLGPRMWELALAWVLATLAIYVYNGIADVTEDRANGSTRPISRGALPVRVASIGVVGTGGLALGIDALIDPAGPLPWLMLAYLFLGYAYSGAPFYAKTRGSSAVLVVLGLGVLTYADGWEAGGGHSLLPVLLGVTMSLWMGGVGALVKDLSDAAGDAAAGRRTPVIVYGELGVRVLASGNAVLIASGYLVVVVLFGVTVLLPSAIALLAGAVAVAVLAATTRRATTRAGRRLPYRAFMVAQYAAHIAVIGAVMVAHAP